MRGTGTVTDLMVASYLAKYSTKGTEVTGHTSARLTPATVELHANGTGTHAERLIHACWKLGSHPDYRSLQRWAHMLGFGGHFLTKGRHYSITFAALRAARITYRRTQDPGPEHGPIRTADHAPRKRPPSSSATSPTPQPAGKPPETPSSPAPPPTKPENVVRQDTTNSLTNTTAPPAVRPHNPPAAN